MSKKPLNISESAAVQMPMKTVASLILLVAAGVFAYTELTARLVSLETSRELFENDLLKKSEQVPVDQEQHFLLEDLYKSVEKMEETQEMNILTTVLILVVLDLLISPWNKEIPIIITGTTAILMIMTTIVMINQ